jgi:hypothetical protein
MTRLRQNTLAAITGRKRWGTGGVGTATERRDRPEIGTQFSNLTPAVSFTRAMA